MAIEVTAHSRSFHPLETTYLFCFCEFTLLYISYRYSHSVCGLLCLAFSTYTIMFSSFIHIVICIRTSFFSWPNNIPLYGYTAFYLCIYQLTDIWAVSTFWLLWIMLLWTFGSKLCMDIHFHFPWYIPRCGIAGLYGNCISSFVRNCQNRAALYLFLYYLLYYSTYTMSKVAAPFYIPTSSVWRVPLSPHPPNMCYNQLFIIIIITLLVGVKWYLIVVLICICLMANDLEYLFMCLLAIWIPSLEKCRFTFFTHLIGLSFYCWIIYSRYKSLIKYMIRKYFHSFSGSSFHFLDSILLSTKVF